jgi:hypothetical protein
MMHHWSHLCTEMEYICRNMATARNVRLCLTSQNLYEEALKVNLSVKAFRGVGVELHAFLTSALDGSEWSASCPGGFTPGKGSPGIHFIEGWVGPRAGLDTAMAKRKKSLLLPSRSLVTILAELFNAQKVFDILQQR